MWWDTLVPRLRIFCVSEDRDNLLMWAHYAKDHTGVVFEFMFLPDGDNPLSIAKPVIYVERPEPFFTEAEWLDDMTSIRKLDRDWLFLRYPLLKSDHWKYEREWRVWYPLDHPQDALYDDLDIRPAEFAALYIGCRAEPATVAKIVDLTRTAFPATKIFQARKSEMDYALEYDEIKNYN